MCWALQSGRHNCNTPQKPSAPEQSFMPRAGGRSGTLNNTMRTTKEQASCLQHRSTITLQEKARQNRTILLQLQRGQLFSGL